MNEILSIDFDVKTGKLKKGLGEARDDISGFQKRIESGEGISLSINKSRIQQDLQDVTRLIKIAHDKGDFNAEIALRADQNLLKQQLTQANRELTNFLRTGEKDVSVLGKLFGSLEQKIEGVEVELIKMGRSEKEVGHLRARMNELDASFKSGRISAQQMAVEMNKLEKEMNDVKNAPQGFQEKMGVAYGKAMGYIALIITALYSLKSAFDEALEGERIDIQLSNRLNNIGKNVGRTKEEIKSLSSSLSDATTIDEDAITNMESRLLNFSNIHTDTFDRASRVILDYATSMNDGVTPSVDDLSASADTLGKVLNNPFEAITKLTKAGMYFTEEEKKTMKFMKDHGDLMGAQELILQKLEKQYAGSADGIKDSTQGMVNEVKNFWNDLLETIGNILIGTVLIAKETFMIIAKGMATLIVSLIEGFGYIGEVTLSMGKQLIDNWGMIWTGIVKVGENSIDNFRIIGSNIYETLKEWFSKIPGKFKEYWNKIVDFLPQAIKDTLGVSGFNIDTTDAKAKLQALKPLIGDAFAGLDITIPPADFKGTQKMIGELDKSWSNIGKIITGAKKDAKGIGGGGGIGDGTDTPPGSSGGGGKSAREKQLEAEKKRLDEAKKKEEALGKARTDAYEKAKKSSDAFKSAIDEANKKLDEQKQKMDEVKKKASETLLDLEEKATGEKASFQEKLAQRYLKIFDEVRSSLSDTPFANSSNADLESALFGGQISGELFDGLKKEIELIKKNATADELSLAVTKEKRSETEKITAEYQKQSDITSRDQAVADAKVNNRFLTNAKTGELQFLDKNGEVIQGADRSQTKDFASQAKEIQTIADESVRIEEEKMGKITKILGDYEKERDRLKNNYFESDKNFRILQENMAKTFFENDIARMKEQTRVAVDLATALNNVVRLGGTPNVTNVTTVGPTTNSNTQVVQVKTVADIPQINKTLGIGITLKK